MCGQNVFLRQNLNFVAFSIFNYYQPFNSLTLFHWQTRMDEGIFTVPTVQYEAHEGTTSGIPYCKIPTIYTYAFYFQLFFKNSFLGMLMLINKVGMLTQTRMEGVGVTFPSMGLMRGQNVFLLSQNPEMFLRCKLYSLPKIEVEVIQQGPFRRPFVLVGFLLTPLRYSPNGLVVSTRK